MNQSQNQSLPQARVQVAHPYLALMGLYLGGFAGMYSETALNIALPELSTAFGVETSIAQWLVVGYMLAIGIVLPFASILMKWFPARKLTLFALGSFFVGSLISGFAPNFEIALFGRAIQGIGTGLVLPMMFAMVMEVMPPHKIGAAMGITALVIMFAPAIGPTLAGFLVGVLSWRFIFFSFALILLVGIIFALKFEVDPYELTKPHIDVMSVLASCLGFGGIVLGVGISSLFGWLSVPVIAALVVGIVFLALYVRRQLSMNAPVLDLHAFTFQGFRVGAVCMMLNFGITLSAMYVLPQYYQNGMLLAVAFTGIVMLPGGIVNAFVSMLAGRIFDRIGARIPALTGFALSAIGAAMLLFATPESSLFYVIVCHIIMMIGVPLAMSPCQTHALSSLPHRLSTDGSTILNTMQQVLGAVCTAVATNLLTVGQEAYFAAGGTDSALAFTQGAHYGFIFTLALAVLGFILATRIKKLAAPAEEPSATSEQSALPRIPSLSDLMHSDVYTIAEEQTALDALRLFSEHGISGAPVINREGELVGFISDGDVIATLSRQTPSFAGGFYIAAISEDDEELGRKLSALTSTRVSDIMTRNVISAQMGDDVRDVCKVLSERHLKKIPVLDGGRMVGVVNRSDVTSYAVSIYEAEAKRAAN